MTHELPTKTYTSPSGVFSVVVDPSDRRGAGAATYHFSRDGDLVMTVEHPFALWDAELTDNGVLAGFAYSAGYSERYDQTGEFIVAVASSDGAALVLERMPRIDSRFFHTAPDPRARGVFVDAAGDRLVVRVNHVDLNQPGEQWWVYWLGSGDARPRLGIVPPIASARATFDARPIAGTPLSVVHWWRSRDSTDDARSGTTFSVVDEIGTTIWLLDLPDDYPGDATADDRARQQQLISGAITSRDPRRFALRHAAAGEIVHYEAVVDSAAPSGWKIVERNRVAESFDAVAETRADTPVDVSVRQLPLAQLGSHRLGTDPQPSTGVDLSGIDTFAINARGHFAVIVTPGCDDAESRLLLLDPNGALTAELELSRWFTDCRQKWHLTALHDGRWLVAGSAYGEDARSTLVTVTADGEHATRLDGFDIEGIESIAVLDDGIVVLMREEASAARFSLDGREHWRVDSNSANPHALFSPEALATTRDGEVVVLENIGGRLKTFDRDGRHRRTIELATIWGRKPNYPTDITAETQGGLVIHDFNASQSVVRMSAEDQVISQFAPRFPDGREFRVDGVQVGVDGRLWTSDGHALLRLDESGVVDATIGGMPSMQALGLSGASVIAPDGWIYIADKRTAAVHVFDDAGRPQRVCEPLPEDHHGSVYSVKLTVAERGDVYLERTSRDISSRTSYVRFSPTCERLGVAQVALDTVAQEWIASRTGTRRWVLGYTRLFLLDENDSVVADIARGADGQWLGNLGPAAVAADGTLAVGSALVGASASKPLVISLFDADGRALHALDPPEGFQPWFALAFDGEQLLFPWSAARSSPPTALVVTDLHGVPRFRFDPPTGRRIEQLAVIERAGRAELWLFDGDRMIDRYLLALP